MWNVFDQELQEDLGIPSANGDGLSFGQGIGDVRPFTSDIYTVTDQTDARDDRDFLRQRQNFRVVEVPVPGTLALLGLGLAGLGVSRRKRA